MKKFALFFILAFGFNNIHCQWAVTLYKYRDFISFNSTDDQMTVMEMDNQGNLWFNLINTQGGAGMGKFNTGKKEWNIFNIGTDLINKELGLNVNAFAFDSGDSVWVGTDNGLAQFNGSSTTGWKVYNSKNSRITDKVMAIAVDNKNIKWIGCSDGNLLTFDGNNWGIIDKYSGPDNQINDLEVDAEGNIWIARNGSPGLVKFDGKSFAQFDKLTDIRNIMIDGKGLVHVVSKDKLDIIQNDEIIETVPTDPRLECELFEVAYHPDGPCVSSNKGLLQKRGSGFRLISNENSSLPELVPQGNYNNIPLIYDGDAGLWFSFMYVGKTAGYASIGHIFRSLFPIIVPMPVPVDHDSYSFCYGESLTLDAVVDAENYVWDGEKTLERTHTVFDTRTIELAVILKEECLIDIESYCVESRQPTSAPITIDVIAQHVFEDEVPCVATVSPDYKNLVAWEKTPYVGTASYNIFRETEILDKF